jgi:hypothetical protein
VTLARIPSLLNPAPIVLTPSDDRTFRIHPLDLDELHVIREFCWPDNAPRDVFCGAKLIEDASAPRLPRIPL